MMSPQCLWKKGPHVECVYFTKMTRFIKLRALLVSDLPHVKFLSHSQFKVHTFCKMKRAEIIHGDYISHVGLKFGLIISSKYIILNLANFLQSEHKKLVWIETLRLASSCTIGSCARDYQETTRVAGWSFGLWTNASNMRSIWHIIQRLFSKKIVAFKYDLCFAPPSTVR